MKKLLIALCVVFVVALTSYTSYELGVKNGKEQGIAQGFSNGFKQGKEQGFEQGFKNGKEQAKTVTVVKNVVPDGYIKLEECIPLRDIEWKFVDEYGYTCVEIGDYGNQLDDPNNETYESVLSEIPWK